MDEKLPGATEIMDLLKNLAPKNNNITLQSKITDYTGELNNKLSDYKPNKIVGGKSGIKTKLVSAGYLTVNYYEEISWVATAIADGLEDMANAKNVPQLIEIENSTIANALNGFKTFVNKIVADLDGLNNINFTTNNNY